jgi:hypothetical protein
MDWHPRISPLPPSQSPRRGKGAGSFAVLPLKPRPFVAFFAQNVGVNLIPHAIYFPFGSPRHFIDFATATTVCAADRANRFTFNHHSSSDINRDYNIDSDKPGDRRQHQGSAEEGSHERTANSKFASLTARAKPCGVAISTIHH